MTTIYSYPGNDQPETYEWENRIADPEQRIEAFMASVAPIRQSMLVDIGSGSAFHAVRFADIAEHVYAVEPSVAMLAQAHSRLAANPRWNLSVVAAGAEDIPLRDNLADIVHSRFAYFFGPETQHVRSCEPGIQEALRILKPGGVFFVIDNNLIEGEFAQLIERFGYSGPTPERMQAQLDTFWSERGFDKETVHSEWNAPDREVLKAVLAMEFPTADVEEIMGGITGLSLSYAYDVYWIRK
jgi:ubiquinone/menaquinone biosynthesis C-methylase UbiE